MSGVDHEYPDLEHYQFNGSHALRDLLRTSAFETPTQAIAALTKFSHPATVVQTNNCNLFRTIRRSNSGDVGKYVDSAENGRVMLDDNRSPTNAFVWANGSVLKGYKDVQFNYVWASSRDVSFYTNLANICVTPAFLARLTDTDKDICALLKYRAYELFNGFKPCNEAIPAKPKGYDDLAWAAPLPEINDLEASLRQAIRTKPKDRTVCSIQELGWYFSDFKPEPTVKPI